MGFAGIGYEKREAWTGERVSTLTGNITKQYETHYNPQTEHIYAPTTTYSPTETYNPVLTYAPQWNIQYQSPKATMTTKKETRVVPMQRAGTDITPTVSPSMESNPQFNQRADQKSSGGLFGGAMPIIMMGALAVGGLYLIKK